MELLECFQIKGVVHKKEEFDAAERSRKIADVRELNVRVWALHNKGMKLKEIGEALGMCPSSVYSHLHGRIKCLRK
jgi:DNA-binding NarL/FixJ family response regulator